MSRTKIVFVGALLAMMAPYIGDSHAAGFIVAPVATMATSSGTLPLGYPSPLPASLRRPLMTPRVMPRDIRVYRVVQPHIITVAAASVRSDDSTTIAGMRREQIAFGDAPSAEQGHGIAIVRGATTSFVLFP